MVKKRRIYLIGATVLVGCLLVVAAINYLPLNLLSTQQKPEQPPQKVYDYYIVYDEKTNETLMYVPLVVSVGDELITEDNRRYRVVRVEENRAYARFVEKVSLPLTDSNNQNKTNK